MTSYQARYSNGGKSRNNLRPTRLNTKIKSICCRLHRWQYERGTKILHKTRKDAVIVEKVGNTYQLFN